MNKYLTALLSLLMVLLLMCTTKVSSNQDTEPILMDAEHLEHIKSRIKKNDPQLDAAYRRLIKEADAALLEGPFSVTDKEKTAPSGDKHDYASYSRYWWPDPDQPDGLPYIRRDGITNPESQSLKESDRQRIGALGVNTETLGLAYYFSGDERYAKKAAELIRTWFLNPETRMNPNVNHAQCRPGHNDGTKSGVLDGRLMIRALEGSKLIAKSSALSSEEYVQLKTWANKYLEWLTSNDRALQESASRNNHGSFYDVQAMYFALYSDNTKMATEIAEAFTQKRINSQIKPDGSMPEEMARTRPLFYSIYNLHAMFLVANLAEKVDVNLWETDNKDSRLRTALDYLAPYTDPAKPWPSPTVSEADRMMMYAVLQMAERAYPDGNYLKFAEKLSSERRTMQRSILAFPLMR